MSNFQQAREILLVEDMSSHRDLILEALEEEKTQHKVHMVKNGEEALHFLYQKDQYLDAPRPDLIMLDLNIPRINGHELLAFIKKDEHLNSIPIVVFTTSASQEDIFKAYALSANCYVTKPANLDEFFDAVQKIISFWFNTASLPPKQLPGNW